METLTKQKSAREIPEMKVRFGDEWVKVLNVSGLSHDVGKLDPQVLTLTAQPRKLNEQEMEIVKTHAVNGADKVTEIFDEKLSTKEKMVRDAMEIIRENGVFTADELAMIDEVGRVLQSSYERL